MKKLITEFIGTFFLVLTIGLVVVSGKGDFAPLAASTIYRRQNRKRRPDLAKSR